MSISHSEFLRLLHRALDGFDYHIDGSRIYAHQGTCRISIRLGKERERRIAMLTMPVTEVTIELTGFSEVEGRAFLERFDRAYRRGGG